MSASDNLEVEVKFLIDDLATLRERLAAAGARQIKPRLYERNVRFDDREERLLSQGQLLRLRQDDGARLTFKGMVGEHEDSSSEAKVREELEITIGDLDTAAAILERLGFTPRQVYEKYRETFVLGDVEVVLDELPFGDFVELEGSEDGIRDAARQLALPWEQRILDNYLHLMALMKARHGLPFDDLTFENFDGLGLSIVGVLQEE